MTQEAHRFFFAVGPPLESAIDHIRTVHLALLLHTTSPSSTHPHPEHIVFFFTVPLPLVSN